MTFDFMSLPRSVQSDVKPIAELQVYHVDAQLDDDHTWPVLYRAHSRVEFADYYVSASVWFAAYRILDYTPCGVWISQGVQKRKFVNLKAVKQWAYLTKEEALHSLNRRKQMHVRHLTHELAAAEALADYVQRTMEHNK